MLETTDDEDVVFLLIYVDCVMVMLFLFLSDENVFMLDEVLCVKIVCDGVVYVWKLLREAVRVEFVVVSAADGKSVCVVGVDDIFSLV